MSRTSPLSIFLVECNHHCVELLFVLWLSFLQNGTLVGSFSCMSFSCGIRKTTDFRTSSDAIDNFCMRWGGWSFLFDWQNAFKMPFRFQIRDLLFETDAFISCMAMIVMEVTPFALIFFLAGILGFLWPSYVCIDLPQSVHEF